jgi:hypothetical protein
MIGNTEFAKEQTMENKKQNKYLLLVGKWGTYFSECDTGGFQGLTNEEILGLLNSIPEKDDLLNYHLKELDSLKDKLRRNNINWMELQ